MSKAKFPIAASPQDIPDNILGEASTKSQAQKLVASVLGEDPADIQIIKIDLDNLLNTAGVVFWQYAVVKPLDKPMTVKDAISILGLEEGFDLLDLKTAYRAASKQTHPDVGGSKEEFIRVDRAYDLLKSVVSKQVGGSDRWDEHIQKNLGEWRSEFRAMWQEMCKLGLIRPDFRYGLNYSTTIERFRRMYTEPLPEWFLNCVYSDKFLGSSDAPSLTEIRQRYREHLLRIAPNKLMSEVWARKYFQLEFGENTPWVFYLPPAKEGFAA